ncbi:hypothetical protein ARSEF4850_009903 [Beauveria asiatica]
MAPHPSCFPGLHLGAGMQPAYSWFLAPLTAVDTLVRVRQGTWAAGLVEGRGGKESKGLSGSLDQAPSWCDVASAGIKGVPPRRGMNGQMAGLMVLEMQVEAQRGTAAARSRDWTAFELSWALLLEWLVA